VSVAVPTRPSPARPAPAPHRPGRARRVRRLILPACAAAALVYLFVPIFVIVAFSFNQPRGKFNIVWQRFTLDNWRHPFARPELTDAMVLSLKVAALSTAIALVLGTLVAVALCRYRFRGGRLVNLLLVMPLTTPEIVMGSSLLTLFIRIDQPRGFTTIVIAHVMFLVSFVALTVKARVAGFDWTLEDAAMDLGASPLRTFRTVTLPLILPGIVAAALLSLALSIDDFIITYFNAGSEVTFPLQIFGASRVEISPQINVLATMVLVASVGLLLASVAWARRRERAA
jgi:spermidine/putrescine transport system permease protein